MAYSAYREKPAEQKMLPHKTKKIKDSVLLVTDIGSWILLSSQEYEKIEQNTIDDALANLLEKNLILVTRNNSKEIVQECRKRYDFIRQEPSLHIIELTNTCDHACAYCHAKPGQNESQKTRSLTKEDADSILKFVFSLKRKKLMIELQGGEPVQNFEVAKHIIKNVKKKNAETGKSVRVTIVTNLASIKQEQIEFLISAGCNICTSLDGPKEVHDKNRVLLGDGSSHENVTRNIKKIRQTYYYPVSALLTVTKNSLNHHKEIIDEYLKHGLRLIQLKKVHNIGNAEKEAKSISPSVEEYIDFWKKSIDYIIELNKRGTAVQERLVKTIMKKITGQQTLFSELQSPCGMITCQLAYTAGGKIYSCDIARGRELFELGETKKDDYPAILRKETSKTLIQSSINDDPACNACVYQPYCGLCPVMSYYETGNIIGKVNTTEKCRIMKNIFDYLFEMMTDKEKRKILLGWTR
jgi:His-Xaa-Ser system radical SAM maturase HxsB